MKTRIFFAIIATLGLLLTVFLFPPFWIWYNEYWNIGVDANVTIVPVFGSIAFFTCATIGVACLWLEVDKKMKK